ncbi:MAG: TauD/TfdA family dioxygenase [Pseudomonadales bacterium]|nr:TauD/TfdA family dioxygenase [Pseudomonadales bacterium]
MSELRLMELEGCGVEISGFDLTRHNAPDLESVKQAFADYGLVFFRDQKLSEQQHIQFAENFGKININRFFAAHPDYPQIALVSKDPDQTTNIGGGWHTDHSYDLEPALGSILVAREVPEQGGATCFANLYRAYESLSAGLKATLAGLSAVHSARHIFGSQGAHEQQDITDRVGNSAAADVLTDVIHPMVITHPLSGRKALYVNPAFTLHIAGWRVEESRALLDYLYTVVQQDENTTEFNWRPGSVAFWDNRATWHLAKNDYHGHKRLMHRITVEGCALTA